MGEFNGMSSQSHLPYCRVLPPGEFNVIIPELRVTLQGAATGRIHCHDSRATCHIARCCHLANSVTCHPRSSHVSRCRVGLLPLGEFTVTVMIPEPHATLQGAVTCRNHCHDRVILQGVRIPSTIVKIVFRHILFFVFLIGFDERRLSYRLQYTCLAVQWDSVLYCKPEHHSVLWCNLSHRWRRILCITWTTTTKRREQHKI